MKYIVSKKDSMKRLDVYLANLNNDVTRSYIKNLIKEGNILVNGKTPTKSGYVLKENDIVEFNMPEIKELKIEPQDIKLDIVYEDEDILIVNKEKGMVVHPANGNYDNTLVNALMYSHKDKLSSINGTIRPGIVHRIDKDTSRDFSNSQK